MTDVTFVILGATGDLAKRKIIPAIYELLSKNKIEKLAIVGVARRATSMKKILEEAKTFVKAKKADLWNKLEKVSYYQQLEFDNQEDYLSLGELLKKVEEKHQLEGNRLFYLATLPDHFDAITHNLAETKIAQQKDKTWTRVVYEKPFGSNLASAKLINKCILRTFKEDQVFRIDHYLGKELVGNISILRFTNRVLEPLWNNEHIESIQIHLKEKLGLEGRGNFYDKYGALKDVVQNHMLQILSLIAMEPPEELSAKFVRDEKAKVLKSIEVDDVLLGQYEGYCDEEGVDKNSSIETFAALKLSVKTARWKKVPFYLLTGKNLDKKETKIVIKFKPIHCLLTTSCPSDTNYLTIRIQPEEGFSFELFTKVPGKENGIMPAVMNYCQSCIPELKSPEAYEHLLDDVINGNQSLFVRNDEIEYQWQVIEKIISQRNNVYPYTKESSGPLQLALFEKKNNMKWRF